MRFWVVGIPGQQTTNNFLRNSFVRVSLDPQREIVRLENRYMVIRHHDV